MTALRPRLEIRTRWASWIWLVSVCVVGVLVVGVALRRPAGPSSGDTIGLVHGAHSILGCISQGIWSRCDSQPQFAVPPITGTTPHARIEGDVHPFALYQYIPAIILIKLGFGDLSVYRGLVVVNLVAFLGLLALASWVSALTGRRWLAPVAALALTTSPLLLYAGLTFGESLAAFLVALVAVAALRRWSPVAIGVTALLACLTKETVFPIVVLLGAVGLYSSPIARARLRVGHCVGLVAGVVLGVAVSAAFDWFRYHQLTNYTYGHAYEEVPGIGRRLGFAVALWLSPNGGVAIFWTIAAVVAIGVILGAARLIRGPRDRVAWGFGGLLIVLLIATGTLASWYAPFGWEAWGPRLLLPVLPAVVICALVLGAAKLERMARAVLSSWAGVLGVTAAVVLVGLPQVNILHALEAIGALFTPDATCPTAHNVGSDPNGYYHCLSHLAWGHHWIIPVTFDAWQRPWGIVFGIGFALAWLGLLVGARQGFRQRTTTSAIQA